MKQILITGATGNIGKEVIHYLSRLNTNIEIIAAVRNVESARRKIPENANLSFRQFDIEATHTFHSAFKDIEILFLLRPPHISQVAAYFKPLLESAKENGVKNIVFLSVQGAEKSRVIPHNKIERLIKSFQFNYIFVRPGYFMQNLTTTLLPEILISKTITLPSGKAKFNWIDVKNIGEATAILINSFDKYQNKAYEVTGSENKSFKEVTDLMSALTGVKITFKNINPILFYFKKSKEKLERGFALVMTILHFLPRLQKEPEISDSFKNITGREPTTIAEFIQGERLKFTASKDV
ncbi:NmrA family NAD(P)-binding protein [Cryomorpha ignava]|uniref:NmrA family NAD(P)-binding protein n=1 Tax=Cryomorpha ignava TaxID=101383 RepID=A0A7K3WRV1_9FLAO|nr:NmrA family NAD(P)-binding protein [Cryomorpha ignava]NEN24400.1 NmrA family NAD(P)-binding protein [Cryomorpha ignava]